MKMQRKWVTNCELSMAELSKTNVNIASSDALSCLDSLCAVFVGFSSGSTSCGNLKAFRLVINDYSILR